MTGPNAITPPGELHRLAKYPNPWDWPDWA